MQVTPKDSSAESERRLDANINVSADMHNSHSMIFEEKRGIALSEQHHDHIGALSVQEKISASSSNDDDELSLGFLIQNFTE